MLRLALILLLIAPSRIDAQVASDSAAITGIVTKLFDAMRTRAFSRMLGCELVGEGTSERGRR